VIDDITGYNSAIRNINWTLSHYSSESFKNTLSKLGPKIANS
jgi:hypothetical protein